MQKPLIPTSGQPVSFQERQLARARSRLLDLRAQAATVYGDKGPFAALGVQRYQNDIRNAELEIGLWEGRAAE